MSEKPILFHKGNENVEEIEKFLADHQVELEKKDINEMEMVRMLEDLGGDTAKVPALYADGMLYPGKEKITEFMEQWYTQG